MEKHTLENENIQFTITHRAVCDEHDFTGPWRANIQDAYKDAENHQSQCDDHIIHIETQQSTMTKFK